jgi:hypothetical protein
MSKRTSKGLSNIRSIIENSASAFKKDLTAIRAIVSNEKDRAEAEIEFKKTDTGKKIEELKKINLTELQSGDLQIIQEDLEKEFSEKEFSEPIEERIITKKEMSFFN